MSNKAAGRRIQPISIAHYFGRKQWFLPYAFRYFKTYHCQTLIEAFAGSGVVGLSLLHAGIVERLVLVERDKRLVSMHEGVLNDPTLVDRYEAFECTRESVEHLLATDTSAFRYLVQSRVKNRAKFDGGFRPDAGERLCKQMVIENIRRVQAMRDRITIIHALDDSLEVMRRYVNDPRAACFADPPYTSEGSGGGYHYRYKFPGQHNHKRLFSLLSEWRGPWLLTEDNCRTIRHLALLYRFTFKRLRMYTAAHVKKSELMLWRKRRIF